MKIVGTIVNSKLNLVGLLVKGKPIELGYKEGKDYMMTPYKLSDIKTMIKEGKLKDYRLDNNGDIIGVSKKLSDLPMYDSNGNFIDKRIELRSIIEANGDLVGAVLYFPAMGQEKKVKVSDLSTLYNYCEPINFMLRKRDDTYYITGKGETKKNDIPVIEESTKLNLNPPETNNTYIPFKLTPENIHMLGLEADKSYEKLTLPETFEYEGKKYIFTDMDIECLCFLKCNILRLPDSVITIEGKLLGSFPDTLYLGSKVKNINIEPIKSHLLKNIFVSENNPYFSDIDGVLYNKDKTIVLSYGWSRPNKRYILPSGVTIISPQAFHNLLYLRSIFIPKTVKSIGEEAFFYCADLHTIYYEGTEEEWKKIKKGKKWNYYAGRYSLNGKCTVICNTSLKSL